MNLETNVVYLIIYTGVKRGDKMIMRTFHWIWEIGGREVNASLAAHRRYDKPTPPIRWTPPQHSHTHFLDLTIIISPTDPLSGLTPTDFIKKKHK